MVVYTEQEDKEGGLEDGNDVGTVLGHELDYIVMVSSARNQDQYQELNESRIVVSLITVHDTESLFEEAGLKIKTLPFTLGI